MCKSKCKVLDCHLCESQCDCTACNHFDILILSSTLEMNCMPIDSFCFIFCFYSIFLSCSQCLRVGRSKIPEQRTSLKQIRWISCSAFNGKIKQKFNVKVAMSLFLLNILRIERLDKNRGTFWWFLYFRLRSGPILSDKSNGKILL